MIINWTVLILVFNPRDLYFLGVLKNNNNKKIRNKK